MKELSINEIKEMLADKDDDYNLPFKKFQRKREWQLHDLISGKTVIFLDLKYLILFRDLFSANGHLNVKGSDRTMYMDIFNLLKRLTVAGKIVCVISSSIIDEMDKIDEQRRKETAKVFDSIGQGVIFNNININLNEIVNVDRVISGEPLIPRYFLSAVFESNPFFSQMMLQKFDGLSDSIKNIGFDQLCTLTLQEYVSGHQVKKDNSGDIVAEIFNSAKLENKEILNFQSLIEKELDSIINKFTEWQLYPLKNIIQGNRHFDLFKEYAPHMYLMAAIHAAMAVNRDQRYKSNDYYDLLHSCSAVGYADVFFTEKRFHHLLTTAPVNAEKIYKAKILSDANGIFNFLSNLA